VNRRLAAGGVLALWLVGMGVLVRREYFRPHLERLAESAARINPASIYYSVEKDGQQVGFASSIIDTATTSVTVTDRFEADVPATRGMGMRRTSSLTKVELSRTLHVNAFGLASAAEGAALSAQGHTEGDSVMVVTVYTHANDSVSHRVKLDGPVLMPTLVPLGVAFSDEPGIGKHYVLPVFDPVTLSVIETRLDIRAESLFVVSDSAVFDSTTHLWRGVTPDTVRGWQVKPVSGDAFDGWVDDQGRVVETTQLGFQLRRVPYEVAFENWRITSGHCHKTSILTPCR
jgi:hypothetical protein